MQDTLPTLGDTEQFRHAMWSRPSSEGLTDGVYALRCAIHKATIPLDGRPNCEFIIEYLAETYDESVHHKASDLVWLVGDVVWRRHLFANRINIKVHMEKRPDKRANLVSQREAMKRIQEQLVEAIILSRL
jgi:predicted RNase H-like nuclease